MIKASIGQYRVMAGRLAQTPGPRVWLDRRRKCGALRDRVFDCAVILFWFSIYQRHGGAADLAKTERTYAS